MSWTKLGTISDTSAITFTPKLSILAGVDCNMVVKAGDTEPANTSDGEIYHTFAGGTNVEWTSDNVASAGTYSVWLDEPTRATSMLSGSDSWTSISGFGVMTSLLVLSIFAAEIVGDLSFLQTLTSLTSLSVRTNNISGDMSALRYISAAISISLYDNDFSSTDIDGGCIAVLDSVEADNRVGTLSIQTNSPPSSTGLTAIYKLQALYGWTVNYDTSSAKVQINTLAELQAIGTDSTTLGYDYIQMQDINAVATRSPLYGTGETGDPIGMDIGNTSGSANEGWKPIGDLTNKFNGAFNGYGNTIASLFFKRTGIHYTGLFGVIYGDTVENVKLTDIDYTGVNSVGGVAGYTLSGVRNCEVTGVIKAGNSVGGVAGRTYSTNTKNLKSAVTLVCTGGSIGGILGKLENASATLENCVALGTVSGTTNVNVVVGDINGGTITNCYYNSDIATDANATGLTTEELADQSNFSGLDFSSIWYMDKFSPALKIFRELSLSGRGRFTGSGRFI